MRSLHLPNPDVYSSALELEVARPLPKDSEFLIQVLAAGLLPRHPVPPLGVVSHAGQPESSSTAGQSFSGIVAWAPKNSELRIGDEVFGLNAPELAGTGAEYCVAPAACVYRKPPNLSHTEAAANVLRAVAAVWVLAEENGGVKPTDLDYTGYLPVALLNALRDQKLTAPTLETLSRLLQSRKIPVTPAGSVSLSAAVSLLHQGRKNFETEPLVIAFQPVANPGARTIRHTIDLLWTMILSLIITDFIRGIYKLWTHGNECHNWANVLVILACGFFLSKQTADLFLYYKQLENYEPKYTVGRQWTKMLRYMAENSIELLILFFTYGSVQAISGDNAERHLVGGHLNLQAGSGLLFWMMCTECSWFFWDILLGWKRWRNITEQFTSGFPPKTGWLSLRILVFRVWLRSMRKEDKYLKRWLSLNICCPIALGILWAWYRYLYAGSQGIPDHAALVWVFLPVIFYFILYQCLLEAYYLGRPGPPRGPWVDMDVAEELLASANSTSDFH